VSATDNWCTPKWLADAIGPVDLDPCSNEHSHIQARCRVAPPADGLCVEWFGRTFVNPPYSAPLAWARKAVASRGAATTAMLVKLDPTTRWWEALIDGGGQVHLFRHRLRFESPADSRGMVANFPSALVIVGDTAPWDALVADLFGSAHVWRAA